MRLERTIYCAEVYRRSGLFDKTDAGYVLVTKSGGVDKKSLDGTVVRIQTSEGNFGTQVHPPSCTGEACTAGDSRFYRDTFSPFQA